MVSMGLSFESGLFVFAAILRTETITGASNLWLKYGAGSAQAAQGSARAILSPWKQTTISAQLQMAVKSDWLGVRCPYLQPLNAHKHAHAAVGRAVPAVADRRSLQKKCNLCLLKDTNI
jgi:hypothetical protein